jgi:hypothetical protein
MATSKNAGGKKTVYPHVVMHGASAWALELAETTKQRSHYSSLLCILSMAFSLEAYFNYLGEKIIPRWKADHEWKSPTEKLDLLALRVGYKLNHKSREYDSFSRAFNVRKALVHGKVESIIGSWNTAQKGRNLIDALETEWEKLAKPKAARIIYDSCLKLVTELHSASPIGGSPLGLSMHGIGRIRE